MVGVLALLKRTKVLYQTKNQASGTRFELIYKPPIRPDQYQISVSDIRLLTYPDIQCKPDSDSKSYQIWLRLPLQFVALFKVLLK